MPVPGRGFKAEMLFGSKIPLHRANQADQQEDGSDQHVKAVETGSHEEGGAVNRFLEGKWSVHVFVDLYE